MKKRFLPLFVLGMLSGTASAQRATDVLDRGLVAVQVKADSKLNKEGGIFCSWRMPAEEYYDVKYNIYRDGTKLNSEPLNVSNYLDKSGSTSSSYQVQAVVRGVPQQMSDAVTPWANNYLEVQMDHGNLKSTYIPNDACMADVDGDGELEILLKFDNQEDISGRWKKGGNNGEYAIIEVYKLNGKRLWWIDLGPNMADFQNNENNIVAYDWDGDGKAEAVLRASDGTVVHKADGTTVEIGDMNADYRPAGGHTGGAEFFVHEGQEFLLYLNGETGEPYQIMEYPLKRLEDGETDLNAAWGDGYGHRSTKHFFGAPVLDGRKPSIFIARGIYTRHKMIAYDVNPATHQLEERWRWNCNTPGSMWYGQGYHNYCISDVDWDGRDEIVFGSMVIDDNGKGLSSSGLGHGDSQHCSDFDPYSFGQEIFACNESQPNNNFRDATTSKIYYRSVGSRDDGRANMGKFVDDIPGAQGVSSRDDNLVGAAAHAGVDGYSKSSFNITQNFRIYWDGDLCEESFDYRNGKNTEGHIVKAREGEIAVLAGSMTNNDTKGTPCYQGDVLGDWREEVIMRTANNNIRIYTTDFPTKWRNYSLWHDHQYRQAMVWQMCGYNQTPHASYYLGEMEGITMAPPALSMTGRDEIANGSSIDAGSNDKHIIMCETNDMTVSVADGAQPYIFTDNAPIWTQGHDDNNNITTETYTHTLTGGAFTGSMRLVKQGSGVLVLPKVTETYTGNTDVWGGTLSFDGTMQSSRVWLNRHTTLISDGGKFMKGIQAEYNARLLPGGEGKQGTIETDSLILNFGSRMLIDLFSDGISSDQIKANVLTIGKKDWKNGPQYLTPVMEFVCHPASGEDRIAEGKYLIGEFGKIEGDINDLVIEGLNSQRKTLTYEDGKLYISIENYVPGNVTWTGAEGGDWDLDKTPNFAVDGSEDVRSFVQGDIVTFNDIASVTDITVSGNVAPKSIVFDNSEKDFTISGDSIVGDPTVEKRGTGSVTINNVNHTGNTTISGGELVVTSLANNVGQEFGSLGGLDKKVTITGNGILGVSGSVTSGQEIFVGEGGAVIDVKPSSSLTMERGIAGTGASAVLSKDGTGTLTLGSSNQVGRLVIVAGVVNAVESGDQTQLPPVVEFRGGTLYDPNGEGSYTTNYAAFEVPEGATGTFYADPRCNYRGKLTGAGTFNVNAAGVRNYFQGDWSEFEGTLVPGLSKRATYDPSFDFDNNYGLPKATLQLNSGVTFNNRGHAVSIANVTGSGVLAGGGTYTIGGQGDDIKFRGQFDGSSVVKTGDGTWSVYTSSPQDNIGSVTVNGGGLYLDTYNSATCIMSGTITMNSGTSIKGTGTVKNIVLNSGAELAPGRTTTADVSGFVAAEGNLTANAGSVVSLNIKNASNTTSSRSFLKVGGAFKADGTIRITLSDNYSPEEGDEIVLWTAGSFSGTPTVELPELPEWLDWDSTGLLAAEGKLRVISSAGISSKPAADEAVVCRVFTLSGVLVGQFEATGATAVERAKSAIGASGTYIIRISGADSASTVKVVID